MPPANSTTAVFPERSATRKWKSKRSLEIRNRDSLFRTSLTERFARAAVVLEDFEWPVQGVLSDHAFTVLRSVEKPDTQWSIVYNISRRLVFFKTTSHRRLKIIRLEALDFSCGSQVLMLPVDTEAGWVLNENFSPYDPQRNRQLLETVIRKLEGLEEPVEIPMAGLVGKMSEYPASCRCR